jgi:hypothetical protein
MEGLMNHQAGETLASIKSYKEALRRCAEGSNIPLKDLAGRIGMGYRHLQRALNEDDPVNLSYQKAEALMRECKSTLPLEWQAHRFGYALHSYSVTEVLVAIRDAMLAEGKEPKFLIGAHGRVEAA